MKRSRLLVPVSAAATLLLGAAVLPTTAQARPFWPKPPRPGSSSSTPTPTPTTSTPTPTPTSSTPTPSPTSSGPAAPCGDPVAKAGGGDWTCTFDDEFNGTALDTSKFIPINSSASGANGGGACFVDSPNNISEGNGVLTLTVRKEAAPFVCATPGGGFSTQYTSGEVATYTKFSQTYGRFAVRASFPASTVAGLQSALWLWPNNPLTYGAWPASGEIDIAEEYSLYADRAIPYIHYLYDPYTVSTLTNTNLATNNFCMITDVHAMHEYVVEWTPTTMTIIYDGQTCLVDNYSAYNLTGSKPFDQPFFVALTQSLGAGGNAITASTPLPASTQIDYVRVWK